MTESYNRVKAGDAVEGPTTALLESYTAKVPSGLFLTAALAAIGISLVLKTMKREHEALYVGHWVAPFLLLGIYNKIVKQHGSDGSTR